MVSWLNDAAAEACLKRLWLENFSCCWEAALPLLIANILWILLLVVDYTNPMIHTVCTVNNNTVCSVSMKNDVFPAAKWLMFCHIAKSRFWRMYSPFWNSSPMRKLDKKASCSLRKWWLITLIGWWKSMRLLWWYIGDVLWPCIDYNVVAYIVLGRSLIDDAEDWKHE